MAEDREKFKLLLDQLNLHHPPTGPRSISKRPQSAERIGYPCWSARASVLGGRGMEICYDDAQLVKFMKAGGQYLARSSGADR